MPEKIANIFQMTFSTAFSLKENCQGIIEFVPNGPFDSKLTMV